MICPHCNEEINLKLKCKKCSKKWYPRDGIIPELCPKCKRDDWNTFETKKNSIGRKRTEVPCQKTCEHPHSQQCDSCDPETKSNYK